MAYYFRRSKAAAAATTQCKLTSGCRKHPKHRQSPGVCSLCLGEKLSQLPSAACSSSRGSKMESSACSSASSLSSGYSSSAAASSCSSPVLRYDRYISMKGSSVNSLLFVGGGKNRLTKSRTVGLVPRMKEKEGERRKNVERGFLSKLLRPKRKEGLLHSKTVRLIH